MKKLGFVRQWYWLMFVGLFRRQSRKRSNGMECHPVYNLTTVKASITDPLRDWQCNFFMCRKIEIMRTPPLKKIKNKKSIFIFFQNYYEFLKLKVGLNILSMFRVCHKCPFLITLALKTRTFVMALLIPVWSKFSPSLVRFPVPYKLSMGSSLGIGVSTITYRIWWEVVLWVWDMSKALTFRVKPHLLVGPHWDPIRY